MGTKTKNGLDSALVLSIIESCAKYGVATLKFGDLEVTMQNRLSDVPASTAHPNKSAHSNNPEAEISDEQHETQTQETLEREELDLRENQIASSLVDNPVLHEQLILEGELEDVDDGPSGDGASEHQLSGT